MQAESEVSQKMKRRWSLIWYFAAMALVITAAVLAIHVKAQRWLEHVAAIESHGGEIYGDSSAPIWLQKLRSDDFRYLGEYPTVVGPSWMRSWLPTDQLLRCFENVKRVELKRNPGLLVSQNYSGQHGSFEATTSEARTKLLSHLQAFPELEELDAHGMNLTDENLVALKNLQKLKRISLAENPISGAGLSHLADAEELEELLLGGTKMSDAGMKHLETFSKLKRLDLSGTEITDAGVPPLSHLKNLRALELTSVEIHGSSLKTITRLKSLEYLDLRFSKIDEEGLVDLASLPNLKFLHLSSPYRPVEGMRSFEKFQWLETLRYHLRETRKAKMESALPLNETSEIGLYSSGYIDILHKLDNQPYKGAVAVSVTAEETWPSLDSFREDTKELIPVKSSSKSALLREQGNGVNF